MLVLIFWGGPNHVPLFPLTNHGIWHNGIGISSVSSITWTPPKKKRGATKSLSCNIGFLMKLPIMQYSKTSFQNHVNFIIRSPKTSGRWQPWNLTYQKDILPYFQKSHPFPNHPFGYPKANHFRGEPPMLNVPGPGPELVLFPWIRLKKGVVGFSPKMDGV